MNIQKKLHFFPMIIILGISFFIFRESVASTLESWQSCCGAVCLRTVAGLLGNKANLAEIREILKPNDKGEISLAEISETAQKMGFYSMGLRIKSEKVQECVLPLIVHKEPKHFIVLLGLGKDKGVMLIDPPSNPQKMAIEDLVKQQKEWNVIAVSKYPIDTRGLNTGKKQDQKSSKEKIVTEYGGLKFDSVIWNFGTVRPDYKKDYEFSFKNISNKLVSLSTVKSNCACLKVAEFSSKVEHGQQGQIKVFIDTKGLQGYVDKSIMGIIKTNGSDSEEKVLLKVFGEVSRRGELILKPSDIHLSDIIKGSKISKSVALRRIGYDKLFLNEAKSDSNNVKLEILDGFDKNVYEATINIQYDAKENIGPFEHNVVIKTDFPEYSTVNLRIYGNIVPHISVEPNEALFSLVSDQSQREKNINLKSKTDKPFTITRIETTTDDVEVKYKTVKDEKTEWQITLTASQTLQKGIFEGKMVVTTDDPDLQNIEIPYTGLVVN